MSEPTQRRRASDRRSGFDRRFAEIRHSERTHPPWPEQRAQYLTRFLFWALGLAYFTSYRPFDGHWPGPDTVRYVYIVYVTAITIGMIHAYKRPHSPLRWRIAMWIDIFFVSFCVMADRGPSITPSLMAYLAVILGNGMRYSMRFFREAVFGSFIFGLLSLYLRYSDNLEGLNLSTVFVLLFGGIVVLYSYSLMSRIEAVKQRLEDEGRIDALTGLLNRRALFEKAEILFGGLERHSKTLTVLFADLNKFKSINDQLGHRAGDWVLVQIAEIIGGSIRKSDIAARYGGDEFVLILPETDLEKGKALALRLQENIRRWVANEPLALSITIGVGEAPRHGTNLSSVLEHVDRAMYRGKQAPDQFGVQCVDDGNPNPSLH